MTPEPPLSGTAVLIYGAGRAPAPALALALARAGAAVAVNDLSPTLLDPLVEMAAGLPGSIRAYPGDASRGMPLRAMIDEILEDWGKIDVLINNPRIRPNVPLLEIDEWDWQRTIEMNLNGPFLITKLVARLMRDQGGGVILNIVDGCQSRLDAPGSEAYAASQQGLRSLARTAAQALIAYNIRVHALCLNDSAAFEPLGLSQAGGKADQGDLLTQLAVFLCSPAAAQIPGQEFMVGEHRVDPLPATNWHSLTDLLAGSKE